MKIATWNVNSIRQRRDHVVDWLTREQPDVLFLQEIKCEAHGFPADAFEAAGYRSEVVGQKAYNGVAALSRVPIEITARALPTLPESADGAPHQARYVELRTGGMVAGGLYLPNGGSGGPAGFRAKLDWMDALHRHAQALLAAGTDFVLLGDYNVCPTDEDLAPGALPPDDALVHPEVRSRFRALSWLGLTDAVRALRPSGRIYTFWDYQNGCWPQDRGLRIDHAMCSPRIAERVVSATPDRAERDRPSPSDHVPVLVTLG
ncbi:MAG: exodeoxyribonuclease III [Gluconacetobacter diazotrophicus]|nr:exodeoxyribonuclease III [Gluconacetobacter diazotrophicus]